MNVVANLLVAWQRRVCLANNVFGRKEMFALCIVFLTLQ